MANSSEKPGKVGLILFGLGLIFIGLLFVLMAVLFLAMFIFVIPKLPNPNPQVPMPNMWPIALMELVFASVIIVLGIGTFMAKRWARKIMLILSWCGLSAGLFGILFFSFFMGSFFDTAFNSAPNMTPGVITGMKIAMMVMMGIFYIILPGLFVLFFQSKYVLKAVEYYDPKENWMDACPTPVFAVSLFSALGSLFVGVFGLMMLSFNFPPFAGAVIPVWGIALWSLVMGAVMIYISIGFYHVDIKAWWTAIILVIIGGATYNFIFFKMMDPMSTYQKMNIPAEQIEQMQKTGFFAMYKSMSNMIWVMMAPYLAYLLFIRKYFIKGKSK